MENIKTNAAKLFILSFMLVCNFLFSVGLDWTKYNYESYFAGHRCVPNETIFRKVNVYHSVTCGRICYLTNQCLSYVYQQENNLCIGCRVFGAIWTGHYDELPGSIYMERICDQEYKRVGYFHRHTVHRHGDGKYTPENIDANLCTHVITGFGLFLNNNSGINKPSMNDEEIFKKLKKLKVSNPCLKTLISVTGLESDYSIMMESRQNRLKFIESAVSFLHRYGFNGLDLIWHYSESAGSRPQDGQNLVRLAEEMKEVFVVDGYLITAEVQPHKAEIDLSEAKPLVEHLDFIHIATYSNYFPFKTGIHSALYQSSSKQDTHYENETMNWTAEYLITKGVPNKKLIIGIATYGITFTLAKEDENMIGASVVGPGYAGNFVGIKGVMSYYEICMMQERGLGIERWDDEQKSPYYVNGKLWVGYDNVRSISEKMHWLKEKGYGGAFIQSLDMDDFRQMCKSSSRPNPLISTVYDILTSG